MANSQDKLHDKLVAYLQDMYALENHLVDTLQKQIGQTNDAPLFQQKITEHCDQTKLHRDRIAACLDRYGEKPSSGKSALTAITGTLQGLTGGMRPDPLAMNGRDDYVAENFEIASYNLLMATAWLAGDQQTIDVCQQNLRDEVMTAKWLERHTAMAGLLSLRKDGIEVSDDQIQQAQSHFQGIMENLWTEADRQDDSLSMASAGMNPSATGTMKQTSNITSGAQTANNYSSTMASQVNNTYGAQSVDSATGYRTQEMGSSGTTANPLYNAGFAPETANANNDAGNIGVGSPSNVNASQTTGGALRSDDISTNPEDTGTPLGSSSSYASDVVINGQPMRGDSATLNENVAGRAMDEQGIRGTERPTPPVTDIREESNPAQP